MNRLNLGISLFCLFIIGTVIRSEAYENTGNLYIQINGIEKNSGVLRLSLFNSADGFPHKKEKAHKRHIATNPMESLMVTFTDLPYGYYAVSVLHDRNNNEQLDKNFLGIPKEPVAVSNNPKIYFGPPKYEEAQFLLNSIKKTILIELPSKHSSHHLGTNDH